MMIFYRELSLDEGYEVAKLPKHARIVAGREVSNASGIELFQSLRGQPIKCWHCGCAADRWIACKGAGDKISKPVLNLFAMKHVRKTKKRAAYWKLVMMTRDHIIPKSHGGRDVVANLRPGCEECNSERGSKINDEDQAFMDAHPELIDANRAAKGAAKRAEDERRKRESAAIKAAAKAAKELENGEPQV